MVVLTPVETIEVVMADAGRYRADFGRWLLDNWGIWEAFARRADRLWERGVRHAGARMIWEAIRYLSVLKESGAVFKLNGNYCPDCARLYMVARKRPGFFETRVGLGNAQRSS
jgi:hypothetical protein